MKSAKPADRRVRTVPLPIETWQKINILKAVRGSESVYKVIEDAVDEAYANLKLPRT
jgi:hypothetical protein